MVASDNPGQSLQDQLQTLRSADSSNPAQHILRGIEQRVRWQRRQVIAAAFGACVAAVGVVHFALQRDAFGFMTLALATAILIVTAWQSARNAAGLATLESGNSLLSAWRGDLQRQLHHTLIAQLVAVAVSAMAFWLVWRHGVLNLKSIAFLSMAAVVCTFAAHQRLVLKPALQRELEGLREGE